MTLKDLAIGQAYQLVDRRAGYPVVVVESITVLDRVGAPGYPHHIVVVTEAARRERYPTSPKYLRRIQ